jgi:hypothetical protein
MLVLSKDNTTNLRHFFEVPAKKSKKSNKSMCDLELLTNSGRDDYSIHILLAINSNLSQ